MALVAGYWILDTCTFSHLHILGRAPARPPRAGCPRPQVAYVLADEKTREREFGAFEKIRSLDRKLLLTMDRIDMGEGTVKHMYIPDFMASREPLE